MTSIVGSGCTGPDPPCYVTDVHGEELVFSIMLNRYQRPRDAMGERLKPSPNDDLDTVARMIVGTQ